MIASAALSQLPCHFFLSVSGASKESNWETVLCALINGWLIGKCSRFFEKHFDFVDGLRLRKFF